MFLVLKEDPEDLTHLAPTAGDVCVPLDETPIEYVLPDILEDIILSDCNLSNDKGDGYLPLSPNSFFSYRDDLEPSSRPLSPMLSQVRTIQYPNYGYIFQKTSHLIFPSAKFIIIIIFFFCEILSTRRL